MFVQLILDWIPRENHLAVIPSALVAVNSIDAGAVDAALASLSIEQRIAVKSQLLRAGLLG